MRAIDQTVMGHAGNCFAACIATLLELPLEAVPPSAGDAGGRPMAAFLRARGLLYLEVTAGPLRRYETDEPPVPAQDLGWCPLTRGEALAVLMGPSPRFDCAHCVVGRTNGYGWTILHDPHPDRTGIPHLERIGFLVAVNPAAPGAPAPEVLA